MKLVALEADGGYLGIGDGHAIGIALAIDLGSDAETRSTVRRGNQADNGRETHERGPAPVHRDVGEEAMFDLVPLARPRWEVTDGDGESGPIREPLQFPFPEANARAVAAAGVRRDHQRSRTGIRAATHVLPPAADGIDRKAGRVVVNPDADPAFIAAQIVDAVGNRSAVPGIANEKVVHADAVGFALAPPGAAAILEIAHQLLFLRIHGDGRLASPLRPRHGLGDVAKLRIPITDAGGLPAS